MPDRKPTTRVPLDVIETIVGYMRDRGPCDLFGIKRAVATEWDERDAEAFDIQDVLKHMACLLIVSPLGVDARHGWILNQSIAMAFWDA